MEQPKDTTAPGQSFIPAGCIGGFSDNPPDQPYPNVALLSSLDFQDNMANIKKFNRMQRAKWPDWVLDL